MKRVVFTAAISSPEPSLCLSSPCLYKASRDSRAEPVRPCQRINSGRAVSPTAPPRPESHLGPLTPQAGRKSSKQSWSCSWRSFCAPLLPQIPADSERTHPAPSQWDSGRIPRCCECFTCTKPPKNASPGLATGQEPPAPQQSHAGIQEDEGKMT